MPSKDTPCYHAPPPIASHIHILLWISEYYKIFKGCSSKLKKKVYKKMDRGGGWSLTRNSY